MSLIQLPHPVIFGPFVPAVMGNVLTSTNGISTEATITFDAAGDGVAVIFQAQSTTMVDLIAFWVSTATTPGSAGSIEATVQGLNSSGLPDGTPISGSNTASATVSSTGAKTISGIAGSASLTVGELYALVLTAGSGWNRNLAIRYAWGTGGGAISLPYIASKTSGSWGKGAGTTFGWFLSAADAGGAYMTIPGLVGPATITANSFSDSTGNDERGNRFILPAPATCIGLCYYNSAGSVPGNNDAWAVSLYRSPVLAAPTLLGTKDIDGDAQVTNVIHFAYFSTPVDLAPGTIYTAALKARGTETLNVPSFDYSTGVQANCLMGDKFWSTVRNGGSGSPSTGGDEFTDITSSVYAVWPILSCVDDAAGFVAGRGSRMHLRI